MNISGINIDIRNNPPPVAQLAGFGWARFPYNVSAGVGSQDIDAAYNLYAPKIAELQAAGIKVILVATHQMYGEGLNYNWDSMSPVDWERFTVGYVDMLTRVARQYAGKGLTWSLMNEMDGASASAVGVPASVYGSLFSRAYAAVTAVDASAFIITGGFVTGAGSGKAYYAAAKGINICDGVAAHQYGQGSQGYYETFGDITDAISQWDDLHKPLYFTEYGLLNMHGEPVNKVAAYAESFLADCAGHVASAVWFCWRDGQTADAYGVASASGVIKPQLFAALTSPASVPPTQSPVTPPSPATRPLTLSGMTVRLNFRAAPSTSAEIIAVLANGAVVEPSPEVVSDAVNTWRRVRYNGDDGWLAVSAANPLLKL